MPDFLQTYTSMRATSMVTFYGVQMTRWIMKKQ